MQKVSSQKTCGLKGIGVRRICCRGFLPNVMGYDKDTVAHALTNSWKRFCFRVVMETQFLVCQFGFMKFRLILNHHNTLIRIIPTFWLWRWIYAAGLPKYDNTTMADNNVRTQILQQQTKSYTFVWDGCRHFYREVVLFPRFNTQPEHALIQQVSM